MKSEPLLKATASYKLKGGAPHVERGLKRGSLHVVVRSGGGRLTVEAALLKPLHEDRRAGEARLILGAVEELFAQLSERWGWPAGCGEIRVASAICLLYAALKREASRFKRFRPSLSDLSFTLHVV